MPPLVLPAGSLIAGAAAGAYCPVPLPPAVAVAAVLAPWLLLFVVWWRTVRGLVVSAMLVAAVCGWTAGAASQRAADYPSLRSRLGFPPVGTSWEQTEAIDAANAPMPVDLEGHLTEDARPGPTGVTLALAVDQIRRPGQTVPVAGGVQLSVSGDLAKEAWGDWTRGRRVAVKAHLRRPGVFLTPGVPDGERALARRGVTLVGTVKSRLLVQVLAPGSWWEETAAGVRARTRRALRHVDGTETRAVATAVLLGERAGLTPDVERQLQEAGTYHVLAISGGNLALFTALVLGLAAPLGWRGPWTLAAAAVVTLAYAGVTTGGSSVWRAALMVTATLGTRAIDLRTSPVNALAVAAAALVLGDPLVSADPGFWLSCGATLAMLGVARWQTGLESGWRRVALTGLVAAAAVELALLPLATGVFERVTLAGLVLNLVAVPAMAMAQVTALLTVALDVLAPVLAPVPARAVGLGVRVLLDSARLTEWLPWMTWRVPPSHPLAGAAYWAVLLATWFAWCHPDSSSWLHSRRRRLLLATGLLATWIAVHPVSLWPARGDGRLHVTMLDVGQGDATLLEFPEGQRMLVDAGGASGPRFDIGDRVIGPALRARGIRRLDVLVLTHADADHVSGARQVLRDFSPGAIWAGVSSPDDPLLRRVAAEARARGLRWQVVAAGHTRMHGPTVTRVLHPTGSNTPSRSAGNDDSVVLQVDFGETTVLLCGDLEAGGEARLVQAWPPPSGAVALKVAHHGSRTSTSPGFLTWARPHEALISAGRRNRFGHPAAGVVRRLEEAGAQVWRSDRDGTVTLTSDGQRFTRQASSWRR